ncbi:MacB-like periplasmic core domain protein [uncultured archaeon]|nr:MacB-like periplasmic core domain protein [uncultured archaeon]
MKLSKIMKLSFNMLLHSKLRSWLTILGIFIGVAAVVAIISLGQGLQQSVNSQIQGLGQDIVTISSGGGRAFGPGEGGGRASTNVKQLSDKDIQALKLVPGVKYINGMISGRATLKYQSETTTASIQGYDLSTFKEFVTTDLDSGRYLSSGDVRSIVIGNGLANKVFKSKLETGYLITINDKPFRVVGILATSTGLGGSDNGIYMSTKDARDILGNSITLKPDEYSTITLKVTDAAYINDISTAIETALINSHHVTKDKEDFSITSAAALQERFSTITAGITLFLGIIAAVSLLVGGIGVANTMFTSVLEKTRDIGVMKAIGAKNSDILLIFLFNSGMLGLVGGGLGIIFTTLLSFAVPYLGVSLGNGVPLTIPINIGLMLFAVIFSVAIGMASGAIPAYRASKLKPVEALRYE